MPPPGLAEKCKRTLDDPCLGRRLADGRSDHCLTGQEDGVTNSANDRSSSMWKWEWMDDQTMWTPNHWLKPHSAYGHNSATPMNVNVAVSLVSIKFAEAKIGRKIIVYC
ncbi:hypothetical protein OsJ_17219 [Oryza sativa Japonica Group]|uniref:Uncharacterized protein n=1 Tax=Oryza sativa subsp. japonica TaxID=39947 RepID=B9FML8_ORYSJ|nr:hypothetical protein OsJ_17219 [Oryza sativa Japonica Group]